MSRGGSVINYAAPNFYAQFIFLEYTDTVY